MSMEKSRAVVFSSLVLSSPHDFSRSPRASSRLCMCFSLLRHQLDTPCEVYTHSNSRLGIYCPALSISHVGLGGRPTCQSCEHDASCFRETEHVNNVAMRWSSSAASCYGSIFCYSSSASDPSRRKVGEKQTTHLQEAERVAQAHSTNITSNRYEE